MLEAFEWEMGMELIDEEWREDNVGALTALREAENDVDRDPKAVWITPFGLVDAQVSKARCQWPVSALAITSLKFFLWLLILIIIFKVYNNLTYKYISLIVLNYNCAQNQNKQQICHQNTPQNEPSTKKRRVKLPISFHWQINWIQFKHCLSNSSGKF
jgi:hypothetical protein